MFYDDESYGWVAEEHFPGPEQRRWLRQVLGVDLFSNVWQVDLGEADIENVAALPQLRYLFAYDVADADLEHVARLTQLLELHLFYGQLIDAGLVHLKGLDQLELLELVGTRVTPEGVDKLQETLPNCAILY